MIDVLSIYEPRRTGELVYEFQWCRERSRQEMRQSVKCVKVGCANPACYLNYDLWINLKIMAI